MTTVAPWPVAERFAPSHHQIQAYAAESQHLAVRLQAMEAPLAWPPLLMQQLAQRLIAQELNRYPLSLNAPLEQQVRQALAVPESSQLVLTNGSDEAIGLLTQAIAGAQRVVLAPSPSFVMYRHWALATASQFVAVDLQADFSLDMPAMLSAIKQHQPALLWLSSPNNPTGRAWAEDDIHRLCQAMERGMVVVDEAYGLFTTGSWLRHLARYPHLMVMSTLSKAGFAGVRLGVVAGGAEAMAVAAKYRMPYSLSVLNQLAASVGLEHFAYFQAQATQAVAQRQWMFEQMQALSVEVYPSDANFLLFRVPQARDLWQYLRQHAIAIKLLDGTHPLLANALRVSMGEAAHNQLFLTRLKEWLYASSHSGQNHTRN